MHPLSRRSAFVAAALALAATAACERAPAAPENVDELHAHAAAHATDRDVQPQLAELRRATARFQNIDRARAAGYDTQITPCWYHAELGGMGYHYGDPDLIDGTVRPMQPEILMYEPGPAGRMRLVGVEYIVPIEAWEGDDPPVLFGREFHRNDPLGIYALHVWLWRDNPAGLFADWNPKVSCEHAGESEDRSGA